MPEEQTARPDPFLVLGLPRDCTPADVQARRRSLSRRFHPDRGGDSAEMGRINAAADEILRRLATPRPTGRTPESAPESAPDSSATPPGPPGRSAYDHPSFTIEALPAEAFEALLLVAAELGEVLDEHPPYLLEVGLTAPIAGWCRLELLPDAGASTVSLAVSARAGGGPPPIEAVRNLWIDGLNDLDWREDGPQRRP